MQSKIKRVLVMSFLVLTLLVALLASFAKAGATKTASHGTPQVAMYCPAPPYMC